MTVMMEMISSVTEITIEMTSIQILLSENVRQFSNSNGFKSYTFSSDCPTKNRNLLTKLRHSEIFQSGGQNRPAKLGPNMMGAHVLSHHLKGETGVIYGKTVWLAFSLPSSHGSLTEYSCSGTDGRTRAEPTRTSAYGGKRFSITARLPCTELTPAMLPPERMMKESKLKILIIDPAFLPDGPPFWR